VKAKEGPGNSVIYVDTDGRFWIAQRGDRNYRNNNPGNLVPGAVSKRNGQIGVAARFAVFPTEEAGWNALRDSLRSTYGSKTITEMVPSYAPDHENDTVAYLKNLLKKTGLPADKKIKDFTVDEFETLVKAIVHNEGKDRPNLTELPPGKNRISRVMKDEKGTIVQYEVEILGWLSKPEAVAYAKAGIVDAVIAISSAGNFYLRTRPDVTVVNNLTNKS